ncbi:MAG: GAF domain-containing protein [Candidatus Villigracilaceae bacterium]
MSVALNSTLDLDALLQLIIETAAELLHCQAASVLLYDEQKPHLYFAASTGSDPKKLAKVTVPLDGSLAGTIFRTGQALILNDVLNDPRHFRVASQQVNFEPHTFLGVPMRIRERMIGVLEALNKRHGEFTDVDEFVLSVIAAHAAVAINNARMMQALQRAYDRVKEADQLKSNFLMLASHELRTPLGIIIGYASFLREE